MDCQQFQQLTAWPCSHARGVHGEDVTVLAPPVSFYDGSLVPVYVIDRGEQVEITDDGGVLEHLTCAGFDVGSNRKRRKGLENAVCKWKVGFDDEMQVWCKREDLGYGLQRYLAALFAVAQWEADNAGKPLDNAALIAEAKHHLQVLNPTATFTSNVPLSGISGRPLVFPFKMDATYFDGVNTHPASSAAVVKKLFDVRSVAENRETAITVVIDDSEADRAKRDIQILSQLAHINRLSQLRADSFAALNAARQ